MSEYRKWDESRSPQWKYLLQKESSQRRKTRKEIEKERQITKREKEEYKEIVKDKRILSKKQKKGKKRMKQIGAVELPQEAFLAILTSDDDYSPYVDVIDGVDEHSDLATDAIIKARLGKLDGINNSGFGSLSGSGLYSDNVYLEGGVIAKFGSLVDLAGNVAGMIPGLQPLRYAGDIFSLIT